MSLVSSEPNESALASASTGIDLKSELTGMLQEKTDSGALMVAENDSLNGSAPLAPPTVPLEGAEQHFYEIALDMGGMRVEMASHDVGFASRQLELWYDVVAAARTTSIIGLAQPAADAVLEEPHPDLQALLANQAPLTSPAMVQMDSPPTQAMIEAKAAELSEESDRLRQQAVDLVPPEMAPPRQGVPSAAPQPFASATAPLNPDQLLDFKALPEPHATLIDELSAPAHEDMIHTDTAAGDDADLYDQASFLVPISGFQPGSLEEASRAASRLDDDDEDESDTELTVASLPLKEQPAETPVQPTLIDPLSEELSPTPTNDVVPDFESLSAPEVPFVEPEQSDVSPSVPLEAESTSVASEPKATVATEPVSDDFDQLVNLLQSDLSNGSADSPVPSEPLLTTEKTLDEATLPPAAEPAKSEPAPPTKPTMDMSARPLMTPMGSAIVDQGVESALDTIFNDLPKSPEHMLVDASGLPVGPDIVDYEDEHSDVVPDEAAFHQTFLAQLDQVKQEVLNSTTGAIAETASPDPLVEDELETEPAASTLSPSGALAEEGDTVFVETFSELCSMLKLDDDSSSSWLVLAAYFLTEVDKQTKFSLKELNHQLTEAGQDAANHSILETVIQEGWLELVPDLTGRAQANEFTLTDLGREHAESFLSVPVEV